MSSDAAPKAISIRGLGKSYRIAKTGQGNAAAEQPLWKQWMPFIPPPTEEFWALRDLSMDIAEGEVVGIIGHNGAGKSTLLKILSRITTPTAGTIDLRGRVGSLLEVGTGFHRELTGRENIYLNGSVLGMSRKEIDAQFDRIVDFAGTGRFLDTPVKRYSSGMHVRLAFAVAAHLRPEILIVDEVLSVGDAEFQARCLDKMSDVSASGRTISRPCFLYDSVRVILPAYGTYTGGLDWQSPPLRRLFPESACAVLTGTRAVAVPVALSTSYFT